MNAGEVTAAPPKDTAPGPADEEKLADELAPGHPVVPPRRWLLRDPWLRFAPIVAALLLALLLLAVAPPALALVVGGASWWRAGLAHDPARAGALAEPGRRRVAAGPAHAGERRRSSKPAPTSGSAHRVRRPRPPPAGPTAPTPCDSRRRCGISTAWTWGSGHPSGRTPPARHGDHCDHHACAPRPREDDSAPGTRGNRDSRAHPRSAGGAVRRGDGLSA